MTREMCKTVQTAERKTERIKAVLAGLETVASSVQSVEQVVNELEITKSKATLSK